MSKNPKYRENLQSLAALDPKRAGELSAVEREAIANFSGQLPELSSALGMLHMGDHFGWRVLLIVHNKRTIRKYEEILGITVREFFPEAGPSAERSNGYSWALRLGGYWKIVSGDTKVENRQDIS
ncbi:hypothetical protein [Granulosicoccus antarcticus]|uniref:Uncharacterized protein n=1 Tax=Granulosicoccus antarcticus IMCC3135 TaxID=1192854 RepID=A0A2Z2NHS3_9GAMM|nr:hypothetical protein [Granulosicoccus antarcticus]ASJ70593.1 hypothetical protein IMCC3135_02400 [Granulosicoccus antarcticus IMCC3135]